MTHKDIYIKFVIEYDKANVTSSYPSLTEYEIATFLDKAYQSIITQKLTGNVPRRAGLEMDLKAMEDLEPLIQQISVTGGIQQNTRISNVYSIPMPSNCLYFIDCYLPQSATAKKMIDIADTATTISEKTSTTTQGKRIGELVPQQYAGYSRTQYFDITTIYPSTSSYANIQLQYLNNGSLITNDHKFCAAVLSASEYEYYNNSSGGTSPNIHCSVFDKSELNSILPLWENLQSSQHLVVIPIHATMYMPTSTNLNLVGNTITEQDASGDPLDDKASRMVPVKLVSHITAQRFFSSAYNLPWIKVPVAYMENNKLYVVVDPIYIPNLNDATMVFIKKPNQFKKDTLQSNTSYFDWGSGDAPEAYKFELSDAVAEEVISLAISYALENVESPRLNTHVGMRGLES